MQSTLEAIGYVVSYENGKYYVTNPQTNEQAAVYGSDVYYTYNGQHYFSDGRSPLPALPAQSGGGKPVSEVEPQKPAEKEYGSEGPNSDYNPYAPEFEGGWVLGNCYTYALNMKINPITEHPTSGFNPGYLAGLEYSNAELATGTEESDKLLIEAIRADLRIKGLLLIEYDKDSGMAYEYGYVIAIMTGILVDNKYDYHFYRQDADGTWSHKPGDLPATQQEISGFIDGYPQYKNSITNPETQMGIYTHFVGYYYIKPAVGR